jgi:hypothetical protein
MEHFDPANWVERFLPPLNDNRANPAGQQQTEPSHALPQSHGQQNNSLNATDLNASQDIPTDVDTEDSNLNEVDLPCYVNDKGNMHLLPWELQLLGNQQEELLSPGPIFDDGSFLMPAETFTSDHNLFQHFGASVAQDFEHYGHLPSNPNLTFEHRSAQLLQRRLPDSVPSGIPITSFNMEQINVDPSCTSLGQQRQASAVGTVPTPVITAPVSQVPFDMTTEDPDALRPTNTITRAYSLRPLLPRPSSSSQLQLPPSARAGNEVSIPESLSITAASKLQRSAQDSEFLSARRRKRPSADSGGDASNRPKSKNKKEVAATKPYTYFCHQFPLSADPGKRSAPLKRNKNPCLRCRDQKKGVCAQLFCHLTNIE